MVAETIGNIAKSYLEELFADFVFFLKKIWGKSLP